MISKVILKLFLFVLAFKSFCSLNSAIDFYDSLTYQQKTTAQIVTVPQNRQLISISPYRVYYEKNSR